VERRESLSTVISPEHTRRESPLRFRKKLSSLTTKHPDLQTECDNVSAERDAYAEAITYLEREIELLKGENQTMTEEKKSLEQQLAAVTQENQQLNEMNEELKGLQVVWKKRAEELERQIAQMRGVSIAVSPKDPKKSN